MIAYSLKYFFLFWREAQLIDMVLVESVLFEIILTLKNGLVVGQLLCWSRWTFLSNFREKYMEDLWGFLGSALFWGFIQPCWSQNTKQNGDNLIPFFNLSLVFQPKIFLKTWFQSFLFFLLTLISTIFVDTLSFAIMTKMVKMFKLVTWK